MRVCMLTYSFYREDNRVMRYAETLAKRGDEVEVISLRKSGLPKESTIEGVRVTQLQYRVRDESGPLTYLFRILLFFARASLLVGARHLRKPYDLVHVHSMPDFLVFAAWLPRLMGAKVILDIHDLLPEMYADKFHAKDDSTLISLLLWEERISCRFAHHAIIANHLWTERLTRRAVSPGCWTAILNYPDRTIFAPKTRKPRGDRYVFVYPGSLNWHQGLDLAIRALARVRAEAPQAELHIYGDGPEKGALMRLAAELGVREHIEFGDAVPIREVPRVLALADAGVVPKRKDSFGNEAFSTKILEFMSLGLPAIVSDTKVDQYYFNDSVVKFFSGGDEQSLARAMLQMIQDMQLGDVLARNAQKFVEEFDWEKRKTEYLQLVDSLCAKR